MLRHAVLAGATGLIGSHLLSILLADPAYGRITVLSRRALTIHDPRFQVLLTGFNDLDAHIADLNADDVYCALGTTLAKAGSRAAFEQVDHAMVIALATTARHAGSRQFLVVSSIGADDASPSFYSRTKGRMEQDLRALTYPSLQIFQPSLLLGERREHRFAEAIGQKLAPGLGLLLRGPLERYRPVSAEIVAQALHAAALRGSTGVRVHRAPFDLGF